jgi:hypothetical protein
MFVGGSGTSCTARCETRRKSQSVLIARRNEEINGLAGFVVEALTQFQLEQVANHLEPGIRDRKRLRVACVRVHGAERANAAAGGVFDNDAGGERDRDGRFIDIDDADREELAGGKSAAVRSIGVRIDKIIRDAPAECIGKDEADLNADDIRIHEIALNAWFNRSPQDANMIAVHPVFHGLRLISANSGVIAEHDVVAHDAVAAFAIDAGIPIVEMPIDRIIFDDDGPAGVNAGTSIVVNDIGADEDGYRFAADIYSIGGVAKNLVVDHGGSGAAQI